MPIEPRPLRRRLLVLARPLVLAVFAVTLAPSQIPAQAGPIAIKWFHFVHEGHIYQSGASIEDLPWQGRFQLCVFSTTGQDIPNAGWRIKTADGSFDSGLLTAPPVVASTTGCSGLQLPWVLKDGTHRFIASIGPSTRLGAAAPGQRGTSAELTLTVRVITTADLRPTSILPPPGLPVTTQLENPSGHCTSDPPSLAPDHVTLRIRSTSPTPPGFTGCTLVAHLFKGIRIGNGWAVLRTSLTSNWESAASVWQVEPSGAALYGQLRMPVTPSHPQGYDTSVRITLKGPPGTQPTFVLEGLRLR